MLSPQGSRRERCVGRRADGEGLRAGSASVAAAAAAGVVAITITVNEPLNHRFTAERLTDAETATLLERWVRWHRVRVALGVLATLGAASALMDRRS